MARPVAGPRRLRRLGQTSDTDIVHIALCGAIWETRFVVGPEKFSFFTDGQFHPSSS